jgi:Zn-dependent peptidase ImmA (M78 family)
MPPALFKERAAQVDGDASALAEIFGVSRQAAEFRLKDLGLI